MNNYSSRLYLPNDVFDTIAFENHSEWLKGRTKGIGGSDASAVINQNPYKNAQKLYREKKGIDEVEDISNKPAVVYGHCAEEPIRHLFSLDYASKYEVNYLDNVTLRNKEYPFMQYSPDGLLYETETGREGILEIKTTTILQSKQKESWNDGIPNNYYIQVLHGLLVTGFEFVELRAHIKYSDTYTQVKTYHIERSEVVEDLNYLKQELIKFWNEYYLKNIEPPYVINF